MQYSRPASFVPFASSFQTHRASLDQSKSVVDLRLSKPPPPPPVWASLPTPPMSGTPPPELPPEVPQIAGRRRKRSETPPAASAVSNAAPPTPIEHSAAVSRPQPATGSSLILDPAGQLPSYPSSYPPPIPTGCGPSSSMGLIAQSPVEARFGPGQTSPRTTRKTKAHVASACVNCKKKHLRCDSARPCRRCVQSGKEDSCKDVEHKKRGRPPLRPDEPSRRAFDPTLQPLVRQTTDPSRRMPTADLSTFAHAAHARSFRPLQAQPPYDSGRTHMRPPSAYSMYAQPSVSHSQTAAMGSFTASSRPYMGSSYQGMPPHAGYSSPYPSYLAPQEPVSMSQQQQYVNPIFPREPLPPPPQHTQPMAYAPPLQLPPILPAPERSMIDPALAQHPQVHQHPQSQQHGHSHGQHGHHTQGHSHGHTHQHTLPHAHGHASTAGSTAEPDPKRPKMDIQGILGPRHD